MSITIRAAIKLLFGILIFVGLPLVGWDVKDVRNFMIDPARLGYVVIVVLLQIFIVIRLPEVGSDRGKGKKIVRRQRLAVLLLQVISLAIVISAPYCDCRNIAVLDEVEIIRYIGLVLFTFGFIGMTWAEASLGKQFSVQVTIQDSHQLVTEGPYRYLRHPRYLGIILFNIGISLVFRCWLALILVAALTLVLIWRIHDEEALMHQEFGADWEAYCQRSWRLIPYAY
jgi:protein-S-isoprenylcysteine O-methyltransferase Ste14